MKLKVKDMDIATGGTLVTIVNSEDAKKLDLHLGDRIRIKKGMRSVVSVIDIAHSEKAVPAGKIGLLQEVLERLNLKTNDTVEIKLEEKPESVNFIKKKLNGEQLSHHEINQIVHDIVENKLSDIELTYFVSACHSNVMTKKETVALTKAMIKNGDILKINKYPVIDKHCSGGVAGNRTTMVVVPIIATTGLVMPKTSSRSITSPAGTADTMEVLAPVTMTLDKMKRVLHKTNACMVWGGAINLAPADDRIIRVEHPLSIDSRSQLLASILAKKASVSSTHVLVDIPITKGGKIPNMKSALELKKQFEEIGKEVGLKIKVVVTDGNEPIGNGFGPALEARDVLKVLMFTHDAPKDLLNKSVRIAGEIFEMVGMSKKGHGAKKALDILRSGDAMKKMKEIIKEQGGDPYIMPDDIKIGVFTYDAIATHSFKIKTVHNENISRIARIAGAPNDKGAGLFLYKRKGMSVKKGDKLFTIYSNNKQRLRFAIDFYENFGKDTIV